MKIRSYAKLKAIFSSQYNKKAMCSVLILIKAAISYYKLYISEKKVFTDPRIQNDRKHVKDSNTYDNMATR